MTSNQAWMLKGWLLSANAPAEIMAAIESVIASLAQVEAKATTIPANGDLPAENVVATTDEASKTPKKKRQWSPEARVAAAERLRSRQAAGLMKRKEHADPGEARLLSERSTGSMKEMSRP